MCTPSSSLRKTTFHQDHARAPMLDSSQHDLSELKKFLCLIIVMESIHYPAVEDYWSTSWPVSSTFSSIMKRDRFSLVLKFVHLNDNSNFIPKGQHGCGRRGEREQRERERVKEEQREEESMNIDVV